MYQPSTSRAPPKKEMSSLLFWTCTGRQNRGGALTINCCRPGRPASPPAGGPADPDFPLWLSFMITSKKLGNAKNMSPPGAKKHVDGFRAPVRKKSCRRPGWLGLRKKNHVAALAGVGCEKEIMSPPRPAGPAKENHVAALAGRPGGHGATTCFSAGPAKKK